MIFLQYLAHLSNNLSSFLLENIFFKGRILSDILMWAKTTYLGSMTVSFCVVTGDKCKKKCWALEWHKES